MLIKDLGAIGIVRDLAPLELPSNAFSSGQNVRFTSRGVEQVYGYGPILGQTQVSAANWLRVFPPVTSPLLLYGDSSRIFCVDGVTHTDITRASGNYSGGTEDRWQDTFLSGIPIFNLSTDIPQIWAPIAAGAKLIDLPYWPVNWRCEFIRSYKNMLIAGNMTISGFNYPYRIVWSHPAEPGTVPVSWDVEDPAYDTGARELGETSDVVVDGLDLGNLFIVYREESTYAFQYIGAPNFFVSSKLLRDGVGLLAKGCVAQIPLGHLVVTRSDVIVHNGSLNSDQSILERRWKKRLFSTLDDDNFKNTFLLVNQPEKEVWICFPELGSTYATKALIWNWASGGLGEMDLPNVPYITPGLKIDSSEGDAWG